MVSRSSAAIGTLIVALPGPNDEVQAGIDAVAEGLGSGMTNEDLAEYVAARLRAFWRKERSGW